MTVVLPQEILELIVQHVYYQRQQQVLVQLLLVVPAANPLFSGGKLCRQQQRWRRQLSFDSLKWGRCYSKFEDWDF